MEEKGKISVVINTYNAEKHLKVVVEAVKDFDEVLVCDMESTDSTLAIAREMGCRIVTFPKTAFPSWNRHANLPSMRRLTNGCWWWMPTRL